MGTYDANQSSRNFQKNAIAGAMQFHQRMHVHNLQYQERARSLEASTLQRRPARPAVIGDEDQQVPVRARRGGRSGWVVLIALLALGIGTTVFVAQNRLIITHPTPGIAGTVLKGTAWNVRGGPGMDFAPIAVIQPGQVVRVACLDRGWARLESPNPGAFIWTKALALNATPPSC